MRRVHLDTDIGGDTDELCALAMLLSWADVELVGVTTCSDSGGLQAGLARLIARQGELYGADSDMRRVGSEHPGLPDDLLNFQYDPLACALAAGRDGARVEDSASPSRRAASQPVSSGASTAHAWSGSG